MEAEWWLELCRKVGAEVAKEIAPLAGTAEAEKEVGSIGAGGDRTLEIDAKAEAIVLKALEASGQSCTLVSEELGKKEIKGGGSPYIIVDPLDGSLNAKHGIPVFGLSIAVASGKTLGDVEVGYIRHLLLDREYWAVKGKGAFLNGERISTSNSPKIERVEITFLPGLKEAVPRKVFEEVKYVRALGSIALGCCNLAKGAFDAKLVFRDSCRILDIAAAKLIVEEAGGLVFGKDGSSLNVAPLAIDSRVYFSAASNEDVKGKIVRILED